MPALRTCNQDACDEDLVRCEQQARIAASRMAARESMPNVVVDPGAGATVQLPPPQASRDVALEADSLTACMRGKGYRLAPAK